MDEVEVVVDIPARYIWHCPQITCSFLKKFGIIILGVLLVLMFIFISGLIEFQIANLQDKISNLDNKINQHFHLLSARKTSQPSQQ